MDGLGWRGFRRAIRALETARALDQLGQRFLTNDVATRHHHRGVGFARLLLGNRADEDGMEAHGIDKLDLDLVVV